MALETTYIRIKGRQNNFYNEEDFKAHRIYIKKKNII